MIITLGVSDYVDLLDQLTQLSIGGGLVYDGIIAKAAELGKCDRLVTLNEAHFLKVWPAGFGTIVSPLSAVPPTSKS